MMRYNRGLVSSDAITPPEGIQLSHILFVEHFKVLYRDVSVK